MHLIIIVKLKAIKKNDCNGILKKIAMILTNSFINELNFGWQVDWFFSFFTVYQPFSDHLTPN